MKKIPKFKSDEEAARFWETYSFEDYYKDTRDAEIRFIKIWENPDADIHGNAASCKRKDARKRTSGGLNKRVSG